MEAHSYPGQHCTAPKDQRPNSNSLRHNTQKSTNVHKTLSFRCDNSGKIGNNSKKQNEGRIQKLSSPWRSCVGCISRTEAIRPPNCKSMNEPATLSKTAVMQIQAIRLRLGCPLSICCARKVIEAQTCS